MENTAIHLHTVNQAVRLVLAIAAKISCGEDFVGSMTTWIRTRKKPSLEAIILQSFKMDLCIFLEDGMDR